MKRILVTGGSGFIGSNLCRRLLQDKNNYVICVDNFFSSSPENIYDIKDYKNFEFIRHDVTFPLYLEVDEIYHLACPASPIHYQRDPVQTVKTSVIGSINMLGLAKRTKAKILFSSTSEVYGDPLVHPQTEEYRGNVNNLGPRACYDISKCCAETIFMDYHRQHNIDIKIIRIFNCAGPYLAENDGRVVSNFILQALRNEDITIYGDGSQTRSFQYIDDLLDGMIKMMESNEIGPINIGNPNEFTIKELAETVIKLTNSQSKIIYCSLPQDDPRQRQPDINKARTLLGWEPKIQLEEGLLKTIEYFKQKI